MDGPMLNQLLPLVKQAKNLDFWSLEQKLRIFPNFWYARTDKGEGGLGLVRTFFGQREGVNFSRTSFMYGSCSTLVFIPFIPNS